MLAGKLYCNSVLSILKGEAENLLEAAKEAAEISHADKKDDNIQSVFMVDCISRYSLLDKSFKEEIRAITNIYAPKTIVWGVISLGEIANDNQENIEFYNNTCVVGTL
ncbi:MAG: FIST C-terminal domain-containing protein [Sulfurospirillum sp.]